MTLINTAPPVRWRRLLPVADCGRCVYDQCVAEGYGKNYDNEEWENHKALCCRASGGDWNAAQSKCQTPPLSRRRIPVSVPGVPGLITRTFEPVG